MVRELIIEPFGPRLVRDGATIEVRNSKRVTDKKLAEPEVVPEDSYETNAISDSST